MDKPTITIDGQKIEFAQFDSYTLDEAMVMYAYTKMTLDQVAEIDGFVPGVVAGLIHVSIARANPKMQEKQIRKQVGGLKLTDLEEVFENITEEVAEDDAVPPQSALEPPSADATPNGSSGPSSSVIGGASPAISPAQPSGRPGSLTSLADFARATSGG